MAERLVHDQEVGLHGERTGDPHPLLHATGELTGPEVTVLDPRPTMSRYLSTRRLVSASSSRPMDVEHVLLHRPPRKQPRVLEDITEAGRLAGVAGHGDLTPEVWVSTPEMMLSRVLLPQPDGPTMETNVLSPDVEVESVESSHRRLVLGRRRELLDHLRRLQDGQLLILPLPQSNSGWSWRAEITDRLRAATCAPTGRSSR